METLLLSALEMQQIVEAAFLPTTLRCEIDSRSHLVVYLCVKGTTFQELITAGVVIADPAISRVIADRTEDVKDKFQVRRLVSSLDWKE